jgi:hypothetical protein
VGGEGNRRTLSALCRLPTKESSVSALRIERVVRMRKTFGIYTYSKVMVQLLKLRLELRVLFSHGNRTLGGTHSVHGNRSISQWCSSVLFSRMMFIPHIQEPSLSNDDSVLVKGSPLQV